MSDRAVRRLPEELIDLSVPRRCHVVGVGGPGMAPIAVLLASLGHAVSGSDLRDSDVLDVLRSAGVAVTVGHDAALVTGADVVIHSTAVPTTNIELEAARVGGIPVRHRSGILGSIAARIPTIGVAGTHGKTTTTAVLVEMLAAAGFDPCAIVGGDVPGLVAGARPGSGGVFVLECDESDGSLDVLSPASLVVTNVDVDHLDYFGTFEAVQQTFVDAARRSTGTVVVNSDDPSSVPVASAVQGAVRFGRDASDVRVHEVEPLDDGSVVVVDGRFGAHRIPSRLRGDHNAMNIAAAFAMACAFGADPAVAASAVEAFSGADRRFTEHGRHNGALLVDDYAHLPAEIAAAVSTLRSHPSVTGRVVAVFQPNRFHRIAAMSGAYADCFDGADLVVITDVYASGTPRIEGVSGRMIVDAIVASHPEADVVWAPERSDIVRVVDAYLQPGDGCISMGCGDIATFPRDLGVDA